MGTIQRLQVSSSSNNGNDSSGNSGNESGNNSNGSNNSNCNNNGNINNNKLLVKLVDEESLQLQEERRVLYVGMTRARKKLILTYRSRNVIGKRHIPIDSSRFLKDLPSDISFVKSTGR